jgi:hypothetical protein
MFSPGNGTMEIAEKLHRPAEFCRDVDRAKLLFLHEERDSKTTECQEEGLFDYSGASLIMPNKQIIP